MMKNPIIMTILFACSSLQAAPQAPVTANTEAPVLLKGAGVAFAMPEEEYRKIAERLSKNPRFVGMKRKPAGLTAGAKFGFNLSFGGLNRSWVLDGDDRQGYVLYADINGNGDLADDTPLRFTNDSGKYHALLKQTVTEKIDGRDENYTVELRLEVGPVPKPDQSDPQLALKISSETLRRGVIRVGGREVAFALVGSQGIYNRDYNRLYFDLNGDGQPDMTTPKSAESYAVMDKYVNLAGASYEFTVDRLGRSLTLKPLAEKLPDRASLEVGSAAPEFSFSDIDGKRHRLSDYRGKVVLLDFWGVWCGPCVAEAPKLAAIHKKLHEKGFEVIGIHMGNEMAALREFIAEKGMTWPQSIEEERGVLHRLFRVDGWPTYYLIGNDGTIRANNLRPGDELIKKVEQQFEMK
jgi:thiol-disulfide isomerase/thioredoxin